MRYWLIFWVLLGASTLRGEQVPKPPPPVNDLKSLKRLETLLPALEAAESGLRDAQGKLERALTPNEKNSVASEVDTQRGRVEQLRDSFQTLATGVEEGSYLSEAEKSVSWQNNLEDIMAPISQSLRELTEGPRQMAELRKELAIWQERNRLTNGALSRLDSLAGTYDLPAIDRELDAARKLWQNRDAEAESRVQVLSQQIEERVRTSPTTWEAISSFFSEFWRSRGLNLLLAAGVAVGVYWLTRRIFRSGKYAKKKGNEVAAKSADLIGAALAVLFALLGVILVFYLRADWLLLTLVILAALGILWAGKAALPPYMDQIRMILNMGPVRQGERLVFEGIPWQVDRLHFYCEFTNPELSGGLLRLPIRDVMPLHSRPIAPKEPWFPTQEGSWVKLENEVYGKIIQQSPEQVVVLRHGGSLITIPTQEFLELNPENLSHGFRVSALFGIDYAYQAQCTTSIPAIFQKALENRLIETVGRENLKSVKVEFACANSSSLDFAILADFTGEAAARLKVLERRIQQACVDVCNAQGWMIPFPQMTVHQG